jgi:nitrate reductase gamma subunit
VSELDAVASVYPVYAVHLAASAMLLLLAPFTRFIHAFGRSVIRLSERYLEALAREQLVKPMELAVTPLLVEE